MRLYVLFESFKDTTEVPGTAVLRTNDIAGVGDGAFGQPYNLVGDPTASTNPTLSGGVGQDNNFWFNPAAFAAPAAGTFGNAPRNFLYNPGSSNGTGGIQKLQARRRAPRPVARRVLPTSRTTRILVTRRPERWPEAALHSPTRPTPTSAA
jgi:hypothetical protein